MGETSAGEKYRPTESFENGLPGYVSTESGKAAVSKRYCQDGFHSLRWDFEKGGKLHFKTGPLGNMSVWTGYGGYSRSAFSIRIYNEKARPGAMTFRFMSGEKTGATFEFPLHVPGWQRVCYHHNWRSRLKILDRDAHLKADRVEVQAPADGGSGTVYFDMIDFNRPCDFRQGRLPITDPWQPYSPLAEGRHEDLAPPPTPDEIKALEYFSEMDKTIYRSGKPTEKDVRSIEDEIRNKYHIKRLEDGHISGKGIPNPIPMTSRMLHTARLWLHADDPGIKKWLEDAYLLMDDFLRAQGATAQGSIRGLNNYAGRPHADACFIMRDPLRRTGRIKVVLDCLKYNYGHRQIFESESDVRSMDHFYNFIRYLMKIALMHETPEECVLHLRAFSDCFSRQLIATIKPDGSCYHHGFHYYAYAGGATRRMADQMKLTAPTPFRVTREAYDKVKLAFMNMRWYANVRDLPLTLHGRHPGRQSLSPQAFVVLAEAGRPYYDGKLDPDVARAALRLNPELGNKKPILGTELEPEPAPNGHVTMPYAGLTSHRRGEWLAMVRGYGKYLAAQESYSNANRHGLFFANGYLDILAGGAPVNIFDSGCRANEGWDWRRLDGTTIIHMPYAEMANGHGTMSERSAETFVGGLSHRGRDGLFVMTLNSGHQYRKALPEGEKPVKGHAFRGKKTYFFFDDRIICLGSDIENHDSPFPVQTNLFQKFLAVPDQSIQVDGKELRELPLTRSLDAEIAHTLIDTQGTGYYVPAGQSVHVARQRQKSRDGHDKKDTEGDYATAGLVHGINPKGADYEYHLLVQTTPSRLRRFARKMQKPKAQPCLVWQKDQHAHLVLDRGTGTWGCVFFEEQEVKRTTADPARSGPGLWARIRGMKADPVLPVKKVLQPCLLMAQQTDRRTWQMSLACPDLNLGKDGISLPTTVQVLMAGRWRLSDAPDNVKLEPAEDGNWLLTAECREGRSYDLELTSEKVRK